MNRLFLISTAFFVASLLIQTNAVADSNDPRWLKELSPTQLQIFQKCDSIYTIKKTPADYNARDVHTLQRKKLVEGAHFTLSVRKGIGGNTGSLSDDLSYVLKQFPNHHPALWVMGKLQLSNDFRPFKPGRNDYAYPSIDCYLKRALEFRPKDTNTYLVAAIIKHKQKKFDAAEKYYQFVLKHIPEHYEAHYNIGLMYFDQGDTDLALKHAHEAYIGQYPLEGLKHKLQSIGAWVEPESEL